MLCTFMAFTLFACGGKNDPTDPSEENAGGNGSGTEVHSTEGCMYVGITGFNNKLYHFTNNPNSRYEVLNKSSLGEFTSFVRSLSTAKNTSLFWAVEDNLNHLKSCQFPSDISNVSIVTFTDGLENGSGDFNSKFIDIADYEKNLEYLNGVIKNTSVQGVKLTAYSVGVKGNDVSNETRFNNTLIQLSSGEGYNNNVNMGALNETFQGIANNLYKQNTKPNLTVAVPPQARKERIIFDGKTADKSKLYIEATKLKESPQTYSNIQYVGCKSESGATVNGFKNSEGSVVFTFENFVDTDGKPIQFTKTALYYYDGTGWAQDSEYDGEKGAKTEEIRKSAAVMLVLDCSSSLDENQNFKKVQEAAINFLEILASGAQGGGDNPGGGGGGGIDPHCWEYSFTYSGVTMTYYAWTTEAEMKAGIDELKKDPGVTNVSYKRVSANDEYSCEALNPTPQPSTTTYYIKHPWGTGKDADWAWKSMTKEETFDEGQLYFCEGKWGGIGVNINTKADDANAKWFSSDKIVGADEVYVGQTCYFYYVIEEGGYEYVAVGPKE